MLPKNWTPIIAVTDMLIGGVKLTEVLLYKAVAFLEVGGELDKIIVLGI